MSWSRRLIMLLPGTVARDTGGTEPDPRFTFANERTFLAWSRTALALVVAGLAIVQLLPPFPGVPVGRHLLGVPLIVLGAVLAAGAYAEWVRSQRAIRRVSRCPSRCCRGSWLQLGRVSRGPAGAAPRPMSPSRLFVIALTIVAVSLLCLVIAIFGHSVPGALR
jgi:uncharacterized membrane protein YidH (DUF202 family)